jgi:hypothetical protein
MKVYLIHLVSVIIDHGNVEAKNALQEKALGAKNRAHAFGVKQFLVFIITKE